MIKTTVSVLALVSVLGASSVQATALTNRDATSHHVTIRENGAEKIMTIEASQEVKDLCSSTCELYLNDDPDPYELASADVLRIEGGQLYYENDEPDEKDKAR